MSRHRIVDIRTHVLGWSRSPDTLKSHSMSPLGVVEILPEHEGSWFGDTAQVVVEVETDTGLVGLGTAGGFSSVPAAVIDAHLRFMMLGTDPFAVENNWNAMFRSLARYGSSGAHMSAISAIDIACWDIMGKALGVPVYELLGGRTKERIRVYASRLYALEDLDLLAAEATRWKNEGFTMMKQRFGFGPQHGLVGMQRNVELVRTVREAIGDDIELAADAYLGWDVEYTLQMARLLEPFGLRWLEDPLLPHDIAGYRELCSRSPIPISHGEHQYSRFAFARIIDARAGHFLQPDVNRVGGITEARRIFAYAASHDIPVIPHSNEMHNLHFVMSQTNSPFAEYFPNVEPDTGNELFWKIFRGSPAADDGFVTLPETPGLGIDMVPEAFERLERN